MKKSVVLVFLVSVCLTCAAYAQTPSASGQQKVKKFDVNKDGQPDVVFYAEGKSVAGIKADTDYNGKPDVVIRLKEGKFESAKVDTDSDGKADLNFSDVAEFNKWLNDNHPEFNSYLNQPEWQFDLLQF
jgi:hypothetical protein